MEGRGHAEISQQSGWEPCKRCKQRYVSQQPMDIFAGSCRGSKGIWGSPLWRLLLLQEVEQLRLQCSKFKIAK